jgi:hypothetical protein
MSTSTKKRSTRKSYTPDPVKVQERTDRRIALLDKKKTYVQEMEACKNDEERRQRQPFQEFLAMVDRLMAHRKKPYSVGNFLLIYLQDSNASWLNTFKGWLALGYCVREGEHSHIEIIAPHVRKSKKNVEDEELKKVGFHFVHMYDFSQVKPLEGKEQALPGAIIVEDTLTYAQEEMVQTITSTKHLNPYERAAAILAQLEDEEEEGDEE